MARFAVFFFCLLKQSVKLLGGIQFPDDGNMVVNLHDHFLVSVSHPGRYRLQINAVRNAPLAETVPQVVRTNPESMSYFANAMFSMFDYLLLV